MKLRYLYNQIVRFGAKCDPRSNKSGIKNYPDTTILNGSPDTQVKKVLVGIDIEVGELLLADKIRKEEELDLVIAHHPEGRAWAQFYKVMRVQVDMLAKAGVSRKIAEELVALPKKMEEVLKLNTQIKKIARKYHKFNNFLYLGRKYNFPVALEGALKLKEISYIHAEGYGAGEMKHGPIALIDKDMPTVVIAPSDSVYEKVVSNIQEIKARRGKVIAIVTEGNKEMGKLVDDVIYIPETLELTSPFLSIIPLQLFAYYMAVLRGCDVDKPRNLAKSVTVE